MKINIDSRKSILKKRNELSNSHRKKSSEIITDKLLAFDQINISNVIFLYINYKSEVETKNLISRLLEQNKQVVVPLTLHKEKKLLAVEISNLTSDVEPGYFSILEPNHERVVRYCIKPEKIDTIILPGSVFDYNCGRKGYGGGFYDRFIAYQAPKATRIGVCFDVQLVKKIVLQPHDKKMDYVFTETTIVRRK